jgi:hypothetical protein
LRLGDAQDAAAAGVERVAHVIDQFFVDNALRVALVEAADELRVDPRRPAHLTERVVFCRRC